MSRSSKLSLLVTLIALLVSACGNAPQNAAGNSGTASPDSPSSTSECQVVKHDFGKTTICKQPQRVVALDPHALDLLLSLGVQPVGYAEDKRALVGSPKSGEPTVGIKYLGDRVTSNPIHVGTRQLPSLEAILRLKPDLILGQVYEQSLYVNLSKIAPTLFPFKDFDNEQWQRSLLSLGKIMDRDSHARQVIDQHNQRIATARAELERSSRDSQVLLLEMSGLDSITVFTDETYAGSLLKNLGFHLVIPKHLQATLDEINISLETLPQLDADIIIVMASGDSSVEKVKKEWEQNPILRSLSASQAGRVYFVDYQLWSRINGPIAAELIINEVRELLQPNQEPKTKN